MAALLTMANLFGYVAARRYQMLLRDEYSAQTVLKNLSVRDPLTGCYNRRHLHNQLLETEISRAQRYRLSLTVIMCDLDHFKAVNDTYGHHGGDAVLQRFATLLQSMTRDSVDSVVRYGGEEFLLILPETDLAGAELLAERLRQALAAAPVEHDGRQIAVTASFGVASVDFASSTHTAHLNMIAAADDLLYAAKDGGRNRVCVRQLA
jgi:diguanylate cyclase (GGDEF)-like protein